MPTRKRFLVIPSALVAPLGEGSGLLQEDGAGALLPAVHAHVPEPLQAQLGHQALPPPQERRRVHGVGAQPWLRAAAAGGKARSRPPVDLL
eukprot:1176281-Prorocentrum_minimum.AAC.2